MWESGREKMRQRLRPGAPSGSGVARAGQEEKLAQQPVEITDGRF